MKRSTSSARSLISWSPRLPAGRRAVPRAIACVWFSHRGSVRHTHHSRDALHGHNQHAQPPHPRSNFLRSPVQALQPGSADARTVTRTGFVNPAQVVSQRLSRLGLSGNKLGIKMPSACELANSRRRTVSPGVERLVDWLPGSAPVERAVTG